MTALVLSLDRVGSNDAAVVGGKAANLGELLGLGLPVPNGFVITIAAYRTVAATDGALRPGSGSIDGAALRDRWRRVRLPAGLVEQIRDHHRSLGGPSTRVAVRSSATAEDLADAAFAGQQDSFLDVVGEDELLDACRRCWASLWTDRAIDYRRQQGFVGDLAIAVVVQPMVPAAVAGTLFTADPVTGARDEMIIDASPGLGEAVVAGLVTPEHYRLDRRGRVIEHRAGRAETVIGDRATAAASGALTRRTLRRLHRLGRAVGDHYRRPMDLEWAISHRDGVKEPADGVWLLQARPMTEVPPEPVHGSRIELKVATTISDYLAVRPYPLDISTWFGHGPAKWVSDMAASVGVRVDLTAALPEVDSVVQRFVPPRPRPTIKIVCAPLSIAGRAMRHRPADSRRDRRYLDYRRRLAQLAARDLTALTWTDLSGQVRMILDAADRVFAVRTDYIPGAGLAIGRLALLLKLLGRLHLIGDLLAGADTLTRECNLRLVELARLSRAGRQADLDAAFAAFLDDFGHRETESPLLITSPTWRDAPQTVRELIAITPVDAVSTDVTAAAEWELDSDRRVRLLIGRDRMHRLIRAAQDGAALREDSHFEFTRPIPLLRQAVAEIGRRLAEVGAIGGAEDVKHLRLEEIERTRAPDRLSAGERRRLTDLVAGRKAARDALAGRPLMQLPVPEPTGDALVVGTAAGSGTATGPVRLILGPHDFGRLEPGEILVCPYTNPAWTPLFRRAAAVVTDSGGVGSHAAIVAREYGIPAVMGTLNATSVLSDGQRVTVNGTTGRVVSV
jgi:rifampicin phosphotransferase